MLWWLKNNQNPFFRPFWTGSRLIIFRNESDSHKKFRVIDFKLQMLMDGMKIENLCCVTGFERKIRLQLLLNFFSYFFKNAFIFSSSFSSWWWMLIFWTFFRAIEAFSFLLVSGFGRKFTLILFYSTEEEEKEGVAQILYRIQYNARNTIFNERL